MNSTGVVIRYNGQRYESRLVNFTVHRATPSDSTGAPNVDDRQSNNYSFIWILVLCLVAAAIVVVTVVVIVRVVKVCQNHFLLIIFSSIAVGNLLKLPTSNVLTSLVQGTVCLQGS